MIQKKINLLKKFLTPEVHKITNSLSRICFIQNIVSANKNDRGTNLGAIPNKFKKEYLKYTNIGYPLSTIKSKKLTALTVKAIKDKLNRIKKNVLRISLQKF